MPRQLQNPKTGEVWDIPEQHVPGLLQQGWTDAPPADATSTPIPPVPGQHGAGGSWDESFVEKAQKPRITKDTISQAMFGQTPKQVQELRDAPLTEEELNDPALKEGTDIHPLDALFDPIGTLMKATGLNTKVGRRTAIAGMGDSAADTAAGMTSPESIGLTALSGLGGASGALGDAGKAAQALNGVSRAARVGLTAQAVMQGAKKVPDLVDDVNAAQQPDAYMPDVVEKTLRDTGDVTSGLAAAGGIGRGAKNYYRQNEKGVENPKLQEAAMTTAVGPDSSTNVRRDLVRPVIDSVRAKAQQMGLKPSDFHGEDGVAKFQEVLKNTSADMENEFRQSFDPIKGQKVDTQDIADALRAKVAKAPREAGITQQALRKAVEKVASEFDKRTPDGKLRKKPTLDELNRRRIEENDAADAVYDQQPGGTVLQAKRSKASKVASKYLADTLRDFIYDNHMAASGADPARIRQLKKQEGAIRELRGMLDDNANKMSNDQAAYETTGMSGEMEHSAKTGLSFHSVRLPIVRGVISRFFSPESVGTDAIKKAFAGVNEPGLQPKAYKRPWSRGDVGAASFLQSVNQSAENPDDNYEIPASAVQQLEEGHVTKFGNGQEWTLVDGEPRRVR